MRKARFAAVVIAVLIAAVACGGSANTASKSGLNGIKASGTMSVGCTVTIRPWAYYQGNKPVGLDVDLARAIATDAGLKLNFENTDWAGVVQSLNTDKFDSIICALTETPPRAQQIAFTQPYGDLNWTFMVKSGSGYKNPNSLNGKTIAVEQGGADVQTLENMNNQGHNYNILQVNGEDAVYAALAAGRADAVIDSTPVILYYMHQNPGYKDFASGSGGVSYTAIGVRKSDHAFCEYVNNELTKFKRDGELKRIETKWLGSYMDEPGTVSAYQVCSK